MRRATPVIALFGAVALVGASEPQVRLTPSEIDRLPASGATAGSSGKAGIRTTVLFGDPEKAGPYVIKLEVPPNTRIMPHTHRDERTGFVVAGNWRFGYGGAPAKLLPPGSVYTEPAGMLHFAQSGREAVVVYISGSGPTDTIYPEISK